MQYLLTGCSLCSCLSVRHSAGHIPDRPSCHPNCGGGGHVPHHFLWLHRSSPRKHSPPQDSNKPYRHFTNTAFFVSNAVAQSTFTITHWVPVILLSQRVPWMIEMNLCRQMCVCCVFSTFLPLVLLQSDAGLPHPAGHSSSGLLLLRSGVYCLFCVRAVQQITMRPRIIYPS